MYRTYVNEVNWFKIGLDEDIDEMYTNEFTEAQLSWLFEDDDVSITSSNIDDDVDNEELMEYDPKDQALLVNSQKYPHTMTYEFSLQMSYAVQIIKLASWYLKYQVVPKYPTTNVLQLIRVGPLVVQMFYKLCITQIDAFLSNANARQKPIHLQPHFVFQVRYPTLLNQKQQFKFHVVLHFCYLNFTVGLNRKFDNDFLLLFYYIIGTLFNWSKYLTIDNTFHERSCNHDINLIPKKYFDAVVVLDDMISHPTFDETGKLCFGTKDQYKKLCEEFHVL